MHLIQNIQMFMNNSYDKNLSSKINMEELYKLTNPQYFDLNPWRSKIYGLVNLLEN